MYNGKFTYFTTYTEWDEKFNHDTECIHMLTECSVKNKIIPAFCLGLM